MSASGSTGDSGPVTKTRPSLSAARAVGVAIAVTVLALVTNVFAGIASLVPLIVFDVGIESTPAFVALTVAGQIGFLAAGYAVARNRGMRIPVSAPDLRQVGYAIGAAVAAVVLAAVISVVIAFLGLAPGSVISDAAVADPTVFLWLGVLSIVLVAPAEEFVFRGVVQGTLREAFGPVGAIAGASLLFGSLHLANFTGDLAAVVAGALLIAVTGSVLGVLYELTGNLTVPIVAHAVYNVILTGIGYLSVA